MAVELFANTPSTTVTSGGTDAPASGTQETWTVASSAEFPAVSGTGSPPTQFHAGDPQFPSEIITVTHVSGTTWTVTRGAEGSTPLQHAAGFTVYQVASAGALAAFGGVTVKVPVPTGATATDTPNVTAAITSLTAALANGPATLEFQDGTYQIDSNAAVIRSVSNFAVTSSGATVISQAPNRAGLVNNVTGDLMVIADCTDFRAAGVTFDGLRDTVAPMTPLTSPASSGQASVTVASGQGSRYLTGQFLYLFGGLGTAEQNQAEGFAVGSGSPLVIQSISPGGGSGGGDKITFTTNLSNSYTHVNGTALSDGFGPYAYNGAYLTPYQCGHNNSVAGRTLSGEDQQCGLHLISCQRFTVSGCTARNLWESPFKLGTGEAATSQTDGCSEGVVSGCIAYHAYDQGVSVWLSQDITVTSCIANAAGWAGVSLTASDYSIVTGNQVQNSVYRVPGDAADGSGIVTEGGIFNKITQNIITSPFTYGVQTVASPLATGFGASLPTTSTFLAAGLAGGTSVQVSATTGMTAGARYSILDGPRSEAVTVDVIIDGTHVSFNESLSFSHNSGVSIGARVAQDTLVQGNTITGCGLPGVLLANSARGLILDNTLSACNGQGISADYNVGFRAAAVYPVGDGSRIEGNVITNGAGAGIKCDGPTRMQVRRNVISSPNEFGGGIEMHGATDSDVSGNWVTDVVGSFGIVIENGGEHGTPSARLQVRGNIIERIGDLPGLSVQTGDSLTITGNEVRSCAGTAGMYLQGITRSEISGNICNSNQGAGIQLGDNGSVHSLYNRVTGNTCRDDGTGEEISFGGNSWTQQHGIVEAGSSNSNLFTGNECDANGTDQLTTVGAASYAFANIISGTPSGNFPFALLPYSDAEPLASGEAIFRRLAANGQTTLTSQVITLSYWTAATSGSATTVLTATAGSAASGLTYAAIGVYSVAANGNLAQLGSTGDLHTTLWTGTFTPYTSALSFTRVAGQRYALGVLAVGSGMPQLAGASDYFLFNPSPPIIFGSVSGQSTLPGTISSVSIGTGQSGGPQAVVAP